MVVLYEVSWKVNDLVNQSVHGCFFVAHVKVPCIFRCFIVCTCKHTRAMYMIYKTLERNACIFGGWILVYAVFMCIPSCRHRLEPRTIWQAHKAKNVWQSKLVCALVSQTCACILRNASSSVTNIFLINALLQCANTGDCVSAQLEHMTCCESLLLAGHNGPSSSLISASSRCAPVVRKKLLEGKPEVNMLCARWVPQNPGTPVDLGCLLWASFVAVAQVLKKSKHIMKHSAFHSCMQFKTPWKSCVRSNTM